MTDSATPATAPDAHATMDERHAFVMSKLHEQPKESEAEKPQDAPPEGETTEAQDDTSKETVEAKEEGQTESEASNEEEAEPEESPEKPARVKVKVDGEEVEVTLEEAIKGYSRTEDYKRKTAALAEDRRAFEREREEHRAKASQVSGDYLSVVTQANEDALLLANAEKVDWPKLAETDPNKYTVLRAKVEAAAARVQSAAQERESNRQAYLAEQYKLACEHIPEYADEKTRSKFVSDAAAYMAEHGYAPEEIQNLGDARAMRIVADAMKYRDLKAKQEAAAKQLQAKKEKAAEVISPARRIQSSPDSTSKRELKARINKTTDLRERAVLMTEYATRYPT